MLHDDFLALLPQYWAQVPVKYDYIAVGQIPRDFNAGSSTVFGGFLISLCAS